MRILIVLGFIALFFMPAAQAATIDPIKQLQSLRSDVCRDLDAGDQESLLKNLKKTRDLLAKQAKGASDTERITQIYFPAKSRFERVESAATIKSPQIQTVTAGFIAAISGMRIQYRDQIRDLKIVQKDPTADVFENDCRKLV